MKLPSMGLAVSIVCSFAQERHVIQGPTMRGQIEIMGSFGLTEVDVAQTEVRFAKFGGIIVSRFQMP